MEMSFKFSVFLLFAGIAVASGFGSSVRTDFIKIEENGTAEFYMLFWSSDEVIKIDVVEKPHGWNIIVDSEVNVSNGKEMVYAGDSYIRAAGVRLIAETSPGPGNYRIIVSARGAPKIGDLALSQERIFNLNVQVGGPVEEKNITGYADANNTVNIDERNDNPYYGYVIILAVVLFISAVIYKYS